MTSHPLSAQGQATLAVVQQFNAAMSERDVEAIMALMTDDCVFENTFPPPDGTRYTGTAAVRAFWEEMFRATSHPVFDTEEAFACGDRCVVRWTYRWDNPDGTRGHVRGVDVMQVREGKVAEKLSYVKG